MIFATLAPSAYAENARLLAGAHDVVLDGLSFHYVIAGHGPLLVVLTSPSFCTTANERVYSFADF